MSPGLVGANAEGVTVRVAEVELANAPRLVRGRHGYLVSQLDAEAVHCIDLTR